MEPFWFELDCMLKVYSSMENKLPCAKSCNDEELDKLWEELLDEYDFVYEHMVMASTPEGVAAWKIRMDPVEKQLEEVEYEWTRRNPWSQDEREREDDLALDVWTDDPEDDGWS